MVPEGGPFGKGSPGHRDVMRSEEFPPLGKQRLCMFLILGDYSQSSSEILFEISVDF